MKRVLTVDWLSSNMKEQSGICGGLIYFCMTIDIRFHSTPLNGVRAVSYIQTKEPTDGRTDGRVDGVDSNIRNLKGNKR